MFSLSTSFLLTKNIKILFTLVAWLIRHHTFACIKKDVFLSRQIKKNRYTFLLTLNRCKIKEPPQRQREKACNDDEKCSIVNCTNSYVQSAPQLKGTQKFVGVRVYDLKEEIKNYQGMKKNYFFVFFGKKFREMI